jgi:hypothetical protein
MPQAKKYQWLCNYDFIAYFSNSFNIKTNY